VCPTRSGNRPGHVEAAEDRRCRWRARGHFMLKKGMARSGWRDLGLDVDAVLLLEPVLGLGKGNAFTTVAVVPPCRNREYLMLGLVGSLGFGAFRGKEASHLKGRSFVRCARRPTTKNCGS